MEILCTRPVTFNRKLLANGYLYIEYDPRSENDVAGPRDLDFLKADTPNEKLVRLKWAIKRRSEFCPIFQAAARSAAITAIKEEINK